MERTMDKPWLQSYPSGVPEYIDINADYRT